MLLKFIKIKYIVFFLCLLLISICSVFVFSEESKNKENFEKSNNEDKIELLDYTKTFDDKSYIEQEVNFITTVNSLTKYTQSILKSTASISIVQPFELRLFYYPDLKTLLNFTPGLYVVEDGANWYLGNRGIQIPGSVNSRALILFNGYQTNDYYFGYPLNYPSHFIQNVEVVHGYSNVYFGSNSLLATVNIIPNFKYYNQDYLKEQLFNVYTFANFNENKVNTINGFMFNKKMGKYYLTVGSEFINYKGRKIFFKERYQTFGGTIEDNTSFYKDRTWSYYEYIGLYNEDEQIYFANYGHRYSFPTGPGSFQLNSILSYYMDKYRFFYYQKTFQLFSNIQFTTKLNYQKYSFDDELPYISFPVINVDKGAIEVISFENNLNIKQRKYDLLFGIDIKKIQAKISNFDANFSFDPNERYNVSGYYSNVFNKFFIYSLYFHLDYYLRNDLILALGGKYDNYANIYKDKYYIYDSPIFGINEFKITNVMVSPVFIPKFALIKLLNENSSLKLIYSQNVRFPSLFEVYRNAYWNAYLDPASLVPLTLSYEKHHTFELVYYKEKLEKNNKSYFTFCIYKNKIKDLIYEQPAPTIFAFTIIGYKNLADLENIGAFIDYVYQIDDKSFFRFSTSYSNVRITNPIPGIFEYMPNSPKLLALVKYGYKFKNNLSVALEVKYTSETLIDDVRRLIQAASLSYPIPSDFKVKPYTIANLTVNYFIDKNSYITFYVNNLFNEKYYYPLSYSANAPVTKYPGYKRNFYIGINYTF